MSSSRTSRLSPAFRVRTASRSYPVWVREGLLANAGSCLRRVRPDCDRVFVISSPTVWGLWGKDLTKGLRAGRVRAVPLLLDDREEAKRWAAVEPLCRELARQGADRGSLLVAFGGGVVGDIAGFAASVYMRGVDTVQVPTTVVAQSDSSLGGKTGVNLEEGKNLVGTFHQPVAVLADPITLRTLPDREFRAGLQEVVKSAVLADASLFAFLEKDLQRVHAGEPAALRRAVLGAAKVKARIVSKDERESGLRRVLNLGHTFGHAWETLAGYRRLRHGEAVGWGMLAATLLAERLGMIRPGDAERISALVAAASPLPALPRATPAAVYRQMMGDKKTRAGDIRFVLPLGIGRVSVIGGLPKEEVLAVLRAFEQRGGK